ncbi:transporter [Bryocella elongata]|nr:transporter [Bryocella elongata]
MAAGCLAVLGADGQYVNCGSSTATQLVCLVPYGTGAANQTNGTAIPTTSIFNAPIGSQLTQLPSASSAPGTVILTIHGNPEPYYNLGPILIDRPDSVGQGHLIVGFSAQQYRFDHLDGTPINAVPLVFVEGSGSNVQTYEQTEKADIRLNQYTFVGILGLPKKTDISVTVPYNRIAIGATSTPTAVYTSSSVNTAQGHYNAGFAKGIGDIVLNAKHVLWSGGDEGRMSVSTGFGLRLPTGDALNYLGSGAYGYNVYALAADKRRFSTHVKIGYQWNTNSVLLNVSGAAGQNQRLPGGLQTAVGADFGATRHFTISADVVSNEFQNSPSISVVQYGSTVAGAGATGTTVPSTASCQTGVVALTAVSTLCTANIVNKTFTTANFSGGIKWKPFVRGGLVLYGNVLVPINDVGLRSKPSPSVGVSYNFKGLDKAPSWLNR